MRTEPNVWTLGLDVGQVRDPSALVVTEAVPTPTGRTVHASPCDAAASVPRGQSFCNERCAAELADTFRCHDLGRLPLGTRYPEQVASVREVVARLNARGITPYVHVDVTGVDRPVTDLLREGLEGFTSQLSAVTITSGTGLRPMGMGSRRGLGRQGTSGEPSSGLARSRAHHAPRRQGVAGARPRASGLRATGSGVGDDRGSVQDRRS